MIRMAFGIIALGLLMGCTSSGPVAQNSDGEVFRRISWLEGDYQTDYAPDSEAADRRLAEWKGSPPSPSDTEEYLNYLSVLSASARKAEAEKTIKAYLVSHPTEKRAVFLLAIHYLRTRQESLAEYFFGQLEKDDGFVWKSLLFNNLGMMALKDNETQVAMEYFEKATRESPRIAAPYVNLGALHLAARSFAKAEDLFSRGIQIDGKFEDAAVGWGSALEGQGKYTEAAKVYNEFSDDNPRALSVLYNYSILLGNRLNQRAQASNLMQRYIEGGGRESAKAQKILQSWR